MSSLQKLMEVPAYIVLYSNTDAMKKLRRKFTKKKLLSYFTFVNVKTKNMNTSNEGMLIEKVREYLKLQLRSKKPVGILRDTNVILHNVTLVPPPPNGEWDVLCLEGEIQSYNFSANANTIYWCSAAMSDTGNFVVNPNSISAILDKTKSVKTWSELVKALNDTKLYMINDEPFSQNASDLVVYPNSKQAESIQTYHQRCRELSRKCEWGTCLNPQLASLHFTQAVDKLSDEEKYYMYPSVSLLCPITDKDMFFHTLNTFLRLCSVYPYDKLELLILDVNDMGNILKQILPNDNRIKIIDLSPKDKRRAGKFPLGFKLNSAVKYATHDVIMHFFDTNVYNLDEFVKVVQTFVISGKELIVSKDTGFLTRESRASRVSKGCVNIGNMIYSKTFWKVRGFVDEDDTPQSLIYNFVKQRTSCIGNVPFTYFSFCFEDESFEPFNSEELPFKLQSLVNSKLIDSFNSTRTI